MPSYCCSPNGHLWLHPPVSVFELVFVFVYKFVFVFLKIHRGTVNQVSWHEYKGMLTEHGAAIPTAVPLKAILGISLLSLTPKKEYLSYWNS